MYEQNELKVLTFTLLKIYERKKTTFYILNMYIWEITLKIACNYHLNRYLDLCSFQRGLYLTKKDRSKKRTNRRPCKSF